MAVSAQQRSGRPAGLAAATVAEAFQVTAEAHPDRSALRTKDDELSMSWREYADKVRATGSTLHPLPYGADYDDSSLDADLPGRAETSGVARVNFDVRHIFVRPLPHQAAALDELMATRRFDAIIADAFFFGVLPMLLGERANREH